MQEYEGYFENGQFHSASLNGKVPEGRRVVVTVLDESAKNDTEKRPVRAKNGKNDAATIKKRLAALDEFFKAIEDSKDEVVPEFERIKFREIEL